MFIRRTNTRSRKTGEAYFTHRLVETMRVGSSVKQFTLLNLGSHFDVPQDNWPALAARIDELLRGQSSMLSNGLTDALEGHARRFAAQLIARRAQDGGGDGAPAEQAERFQDVDVSTLELVRPRTVGVEHAALTTLRHLGFEEKLSTLGFSKPQIAAAVGNVIGRMAAAAPEGACFVCQAWR